MPDRMLTDVRDALSRRGILIPGERGYPHATDLYGSIGLGRSRSGKPLVLAAVYGGEVSNDHHAYYEAIFERRASGELSLVRHQLYFFDIAGIEGAGWGFFALLFGMVQTILVLPFLALFARWSALTRNRRPERSGRPVPA